MSGLNRLRKKPLLGRSGFSPDTHSSKPIGLQALRYAFLSMSLRKFNEIRTPGPKGQSSCSVDVRAKARTYPTADFFPQL
jgi:hypothetical protein